MALLSKDHLAVAAQTIHSGNQSDTHDKRGRFLRDLRISVIDQCNFRCSYCMPAEVFGPDYAFLRRDELLTFEEISRLVDHFAGLGARKVRLTGGEPLLRKNLANLISRIRRIERIEDIALTTNGVLLPRLAQDLKEAGLDRVTASLDALSDGVFKKMNGRGIAVATVLRGIDAAENAGLPVKINMVVQKGVNEQEILPMARYFREKGHSLRFIEFMDVGNYNHWRMDEVLPAQKIIKLLSQEFELIPLVPAYPGEVARRYRYTDCEAEIGLIASVTQPFCQGCTRARLSADGHLYTCLFASQGWDLKGYMREGIADDALSEKIRQIWIGREDRYSEKRKALLQKHLHSHKVEMSFIGG